MRVGVLLSITPILDQFELVRVIRVSSWIGHFVATRPRCVSFVLVLRQLVGAGGREVIEAAFLVAS